jgi:addiction module HigA family antidote
MSRKLKNIHPGEILKEEFLNPMGITQYRLAKEIDEPQIKISQIVRGLRGITPETGLKLDKFFGFKTRGFFYSLQTDFDLREAGRRIKGKLAKIKAYRAVIPA